MPVLTTLAIAEALILAHKAAKRDGDGTATKLIETALGHVGRKLQVESSENDRSASATDDEVRSRGDDGRRKVSVH